MAEGAPLLREYVGKTCIEGSNPSGSASKSEPSLVEGFFLPASRIVRCLRAATDSLLCDQALNSPTMAATAPVSFPQSNLSRRA